MSAGSAASALPADITYTTTAQTNGVSVELSGIINTIELWGHEVAIDNLCIDSIWVDTTTVTPPPTPTPPAFGCNDFQDTSFFANIPTSQTTYGAVWYSNNGVEFRSKYFDVDGLMNPGSAALGDHVAAGYTGANGNTNYSGNIMYQGNAITEMDLSSFRHRPRHFL